MTERDEPLDPRHEEALARALRAQADTIGPAGDGLVRIRSRVEQRRRRVHWMAPVGAVAGVAATVTAVVATGALTGSRGSADRVQALATITLTSRSLPTTTSPVNATMLKPVLSSAAASTAAVVAAPSAPMTSPAAPTTAALVAAASDQPTGQQPVWPFSGAAAATSWQRTAAGGKDQWHLDGRATAERFVTALGLPVTDLAVVSDTATTGSSGEVTLSTLDTASGKPVELGTVHLARWGSGPAAPWGVTSVSAARAAITAPAPGDTVGSTVSVSYDLTGATEADLSVQTWQAGGSSPLAATTLTGGATGRVTLEPDVAADTSGFVVVADVTDGLRRLVVTPVALHDTADLPTGAYVTVSGGALRVSTAATPLVATGVTEAQVTDDRQWVYYLQDATLERVSLARGGTPQAVPNVAAGISTFAIAGPDGEQLAYAATSATGDQTLAWRTSDGRSGAVTGFSTGSPLLESVAISPDGSQVTGYVRGGTEGSIDSYAVATARTTADGAPLTGCPDGSCIAAAYAPDGDLVYVTTDGQELTVHRVHDGDTVTLFAVAASSQSATLDLNAQGTGVLLTDAAAHAWSWLAGGKPTAITGASDASW